MICYYDTSAFIPILIAEPSSEVCRRLWVEADAVCTSRLLYVEAAAALAQAQRMDRVTQSQRDAALETMDSLWREFDIVDVVESLVRRAAVLADTHRLRGYDAVHCASAASLLDDDLVVASGDRTLLRACREVGLATADVNGR